MTDKITKETSDRKTADSSIEGKISTETSDRKKADSSLEIKISDEVNSRQEADDELSGRIEYEKMERQADNEENKSRFFEKADKTELYGREKMCIRDRCITLLKIIRIFGFAAVVGRLNQVL